MANVPIMFQPLVKYVDFQGRARRSEFWLWTLFQFILFSVANAVLFSTMPHMSPSGDPSQFMTHFMRFSPVVNLLQLVLFLPSLAVQVRRLHDTNRTGWWILMPAGVFFAGLILFLITNMSKFMALAKSGANSDPTQFLSIIGTAFLFIWLPTIAASIVVFVFLVLDGTPGGNRFGADPKGRGNINVF